MGSSGLTLRPATEADLPRIGVWLHEPHVARWWLEGSDAPAELESCRRAVLGSERTRLLMVLHGGREIGWCQWYLWPDYPEAARGVEACPGDVGSTTPSAIRRPSAGVWERYSSQRS